MRQLWKTGLKLSALMAASVTLLACVEIKGKAEVSDQGRVKVVTTYDFSKVFNNIKTHNPALSERMEGFDCKIFVSSSPNFKCEDEGLLKFKMSDEADKPVGVTYNDATGELAFDAVKYFTHVTDIKSMVQRDGQAMMIGEGIPPLLPLRAENRQKYQNEQLSIQLDVVFANEIVSVDGQNLSDKKRNISVNFLDIADKPSYVIVTKSQPKAALGSWMMVLAVLLLLALAVWFLWRKKNNPNPPSPSSASKQAPNTPVAPAGGGSEIDAEGVIPEEVLAEKHEMTKGERFAQAMSAAAVGIGSSAVGGGANHTVEELVAKEGKEQENLPTNDKPVDS